MDFNAKIPGAPSFCYMDLIKSSTAIRKGIDNTPPDNLIGALILLSQNVLQPLNNRYAVHISSGYRCLALNRAIGAGDTSNHVKAEAADVEPVNKSLSLMNLLDWIYHNLPFHELIAEFFPAGWVHVAYRKDVDDKVLKLKDKNHNYSVLTLDELKEIYP